MCCNLRLAAVVVLESDSLTHRMHLTHYTVILMYYMNELLSEEQINTLFISDIDGKIDEVMLPDNNNGYLLLS
jgi:hypothetical protein